MKKVKVQTKNRVATKSEVSVGHKLALGVLAVSAFAMGLNFMGMLATPEISRRVIIDPEPIVEAEPLIIQNVLFAAVNAPVVTWPFTADDWEIPRVSFFNGEDRMGILYLQEVFVGYQPEDGNTGSTSTFPFALELTGEDFTIPASLINVWEHVQYYPLHTLCLPETVFTNERTVKYYYDINGTPYHDVLLTEMATPIGCNYLLAKKLDITDMSNASIINPISMDSRSPTSSPEILFKSNFYTGSLLGRLDLVDNYFEVSNSEGASSGAPLALEIRGDHFVVPSTLINIESEGVQYTLCLPETDPTNKDFVRYYYDNSGTPYYDSFLTQKATCNEVIAITCKDTDGGIDEYIQGTVRDLDPSGEYSSITDVCVESRVLEYYCDDNIGRTAILISCEFGCQEGACLPIESEDEPILRIR